ncbi:MAG: ABC transporter permease [Alphaproteobacteria bacterium]|nr:ABC transporter permease [Alphaproteobacteria bacterium]
MSFLFIQLLTGLSTAAVLFLVASGLSLIFGVTRILNFAHGSLYMLGAYIAYTLTQFLGGAGMNFWLSLLLASVGTGIIGAGIEMLILRRVYHVPELFQLLATFAVVLIVQDVTLHTWGPEDLLGPQAPGLAGSITLLGKPFPSYDLFLIGFALVVLAGLYLLLHKTHFGILVRAATEDREMVANLGTNQKWLFTAVFALGSLLAGLGGALQLPRESVSLTMDMSMIIDAFVVVVIGGMGSLRGAALASVIVGVTQAFGILIFPQITLVLLFLIMAVVLVFKPYGLFGSVEDMTVEKAQISNGAMKPPAPRLKYVWIVAGICLLALPWLVGTYGLVLASEMIILALFAASLHFIMGPGGLGVFGHALYFGLGAYAVALLTKYFAVAMPLALIAAPIAAVLGALVFGWFCVRSQGIYLAMLTFAFAQMIWAVAFQWYDVTGGDNGLLGIWPPEWASNPTAFYYFVLALSGASIFILRHMIFSPYGYALRAVRDQTKRAEAIGLNARKLQWMGLGLAGAFAGLAGGLFVYSKGSVFPTTLDIHTTLDAFVMTLIGGLNSLSGPIVGSVVYTWLKSEISRQTELWRLALGLIILSIVIFFPQGIVGSFNQWVRKRKGEIG